MSDEAGRTKRKAKTEEVPEKKQKVDSSLVSFEVQPEVEVMHPLSDLFIPVLT